MSKKSGDKRNWSWWAGEMVRLCSGPRAGEWANPEAYQINEATRDEVVKAARREFGDAARIHIVEATQDGPFSADVFDAHDDALFDLIGEQFAEANSERWGEDGFEGDFDREALAAELNDGFARYLSKHGHLIKTWSFQGMRIGEILEPVKVANDA